MRLLCLIALLTSAAVLAACGGAEKPKPAPGTPQNPLVATPSEPTSGGRSNEARSASDSKPGYQKLVERQGSKPRSRFTPCNLVSQAQARAILGGPIQAPLEAPQGPTCIYRSRAGGKFVTVAVQTVDFGKVKRQLRRRQAVDVANRPAYCGVYGQPMLYASLGRGRVLTIAAPCALARQFAAKAVTRLDG